MMSTSVLASVCSGGALRVRFHFSPFSEPHTAAELSAALLISQKWPLGVTATRGSEKPCECARRTVLYREAAAPADGASTSPTRSTNRDSIRTPRPLPTVPGQRLDFVSIARLTLPFSFWTTAIDKST